MIHNLSCRSFNSTCNFLEGQNCRVNVFIDGGWVKTYYMVNFSGMNIHKSQQFLGVHCQGFDRFREMWKTLAAKAKESSWRRISRDTPMV